MTTIYVDAHQLTDGSRVYNVRLDAIEFSACTERDAVQLAESFQAAIAAHTNDKAPIVYTY